MNATYVSFWDGETEIKTTCKYNAETNVVSDIEAADVDGMNLEVLIEEYIELEDGTLISTFTCEDGRTVIDGQVDESI